jgi:RHS repeat-associated protein
MLPAHWMPQSDTMISSFGDVEVKNGIQAPHIASSPKKEHFRQKSMAVNELQRSSTPKKTGGVTVYGYRHYSPKTGQFLGRDPIGERGGVNLYRFVRNDGGNKLDYLGLDVRIHMQYQYVDEFNSRYLVIIGVNGDTKGAMYYGDSIVLDDYLKEYRDNNNGKEPFDEVPDTPGVHRVVVQQDRNKNPETVSGSVYGKEKGCDFKVELSISTIVRFFIITELGITIDKITYCKHIPNVTVDHNMHSRANPIVRGAKKLSILAGPNEKIEDCPDKCCDPQETK